MKTLLLLILIALPSFAIGQTANFEDDFSDQDISDWTGDTGNFTFTDENGNILLQQDADGAGSSYLSIPSTNVEGYWEFFVRLEFAPSDGNKAEIYLMSDSEDLTGALNGYKLLAGENGSNDVFRLLRVDSGSEASEIITGTTNISSGGDFRVKVTRDASGNWTLEVAEDYAGALAQEGTGIDNTYTSASHFGFNTTYTSTRSDLFTFDFKIDIPPVEVVSTSPVNNTEVDVAFSRAIDFNTVENTDFILNPGNVNPQSVAQQSADTARLTFADAITSGISELSISGIDDSAGETTLADTTLSFVIFDEYQSGDIIINEFMKDPPAGTTEYVELKNTTSKYLNLKDWQAGDNNALTTLSTQDFAILPDSFVVISADTSTLNTYYGTANYLQASLPALNNGEDQVRLFDDAGTLADSLQYNADWGGLDVAIERRDASVSSFFRENWGDSPADDFGTPGSANQIQPDETPPEIEQLVVQDNQTLLLAVSERLDNSSAETVGNYTLSQNPEAGAATPPLPGISSVSQIAADSLQLNLDAELEEYDGSWTLSADNLTDIFGNAADDEIEFNYYVIFTAEAGQVAINEFMYDPAPDFSEFVELYNHSDSSFDLQSWTLNDNTGTKRSITNESYVLPSGDFVILAPDSSIIKKYPDTPFINMASGFPALNNGTDAIVIKNQNGIQIDSLTYASDWGGSEVSLERRTVDISPNFRENWGDSPSTNLATPGLENEIQPDNTPPALADIEHQIGGQIQLIFTERLIQDPAQNTGNFTLTADNVSNLPGLQSASFTSPDTIVLQYDADLPSEPAGTNYELSISGQTDIFNNTASEITENLFVIEYGRADSGEVFITEFMYDPPELFSEFVELYNATDSAFNLRGWTFNDNSGNPRVISDNDFTLNPGSHILITPDSVIFENFPETPFISIGSRFSALNNSSDAIVIRNRQGTLLDSVSYRSEWGGNEASLERRSIDFSAAFKENWGTSPSENLATPGQPNEIPPDNTPPDIEELTVLNDSTLQVIFTERVLPGPATTLSNYNFIIPLNFPDNPPDVSSIEFFAPDTVVLSYPYKIPREQDGTHYGLSIANQSDIFGNVAPDIDEQFFLIDLSEAAPGDVVINEFMYDPGDDLTEFVELYNPSNKNFDLQGWTLNDNTGNRREITSSNTELTTQSYIILAPDSTLIERFPNRAIIVMGNSFSSLNNGSDAIVIRNRDEVLIDSLTYSSGWGGDGVSLERLSSKAPSFYRENWSDSPADGLATPGQPNQVQPDEAPPQIENVNYTSADSIHIVFDERVDSVWAHNADSYTISPALSIAEITKYTGRSLTLLLSSSLSDGETYTITVENQQDIFGNVLESASVDLEYTLVSTAAPKDVIVNEILYRRATAESEEFVELYNRSSENFDLSSWSLSDATGSTSIPEGTQIRSGEYLILTDTENLGSETNGRLTKSSNNFNSVYLPGFPSLNDDEDAVVIKNNDGLIIDSLFYNETWGGNEPGKSLERKDPESASNDASNWATNTSESGNSAGVQSSVFQPDETAPEIIFAKLQSNGKIFVAFSEFVNVENTDVFVNDEPTAITQYDETAGNIVILGEDAFPGGEPLSVSFSNVTDFRGNANEDLSVEVSQPLMPGNVVINEIMFDPLANPDDNLPDQTEYIELYNRSEYAISLEGFFLHDEPDENNEVRSISPVTTQFKWIPAGDYALVYAEDEASEFAGSQLAEYFEMENEDDQFYIRIDRSSLSLASSGDAIFLSDSTGTTIDSVFYDESWQNPNLFDTDGVALERIDPNGPSNDDSNWSSSTRVNGGTPGEQNSIFQQAGAGPEETGITFTPNPFSPDGDGFDDNLFINYKLEEPDYLLRVRIFDRYGREVRELADGKQAGFEGSLIWDGLTDDNRKNRVGIYIVLFEAYNSANGKNRTFKETVVLARKF